MEENNPLRPAQGCITGLILGALLWMVFIVGLCLLGWLPWI